MKNIDSENIVLVSSDKFDENTMENETITIVFGDDSGGGGGGGGEFPEPEWIGGNFIEVPEIVRGGVRDTIIHNGFMYLACNMAGIYKYNIETKQFLNTNMSTYGYGFYSCGKTSNSTVYFGSNGWGVAGIWKLDESTGNIVKTNITTGTWKAIAASEDDELYFCSDSNTGIWKLNNITGNIEQTNKTIGSFYIAKTVLNSTTFFGSGVNDGLWMLDRNSNTIVKTAGITSGTINDMEISSKGILYVAINNNGVHKILDSYGNTTKISSLNYAYFYKNHKDNVIWASSGTSPYYLNDEGDSLIPWGYNYPPYFYSMAFSKVGEGYILSQTGIWKLWTDADGNQLFIETNINSDLYDSTFNTPEGDLYLTTGDTELPTLKLNPIIYGRAAGEWIGIDSGGSLNDAKLTGIPTLNEVPFQLHKLDDMNANISIGITDAGDDTSQGYRRINIGNINRFNDGCIAIGNDLETMQDSIAMGNGARAHYHSFAIGGNAQMESIVLNGQEAVEYSLAIMIQSSAQWNSIAIGEMSAASQDSCAISKESRAEWNSIAIGPVSYAYQSSISLGMAANSHSSSIAVGHDSAASEGSIALGTMAQANMNSVALGEMAWADNNEVQLGNDQQNVYTYNPVQERSDIRDKTDIETTDLGLNFINKLNPKKYKWDYRDSYRTKEEVEYEEEIEVEEEQENEQGEKEKVKVKKVVTKKKIVFKDNPSDGSKKRKRYHYGLIAQEVKEVCDELNVDFGGYQDHKVKNGRDILTLGYNEFIAPMIKAIQELSDKQTEQQKIIEQQAAEIAMLKNKI